MTMKKSIYKPGSLFIASLLLLSYSISAQELTREFSKEYKVEQGKTLDLNNKYGNIVVETSETDQVRIDVKVTLRYPNREKAERLLSYIDIRFEEDSDRISARTVIDDKFSFTGWGGDSKKFTINYNVKMPEWMDLNLTNRYGNTDLDDLDGKVKLDIKYGNLTASKIRRGNQKPLNSLTLSYGKGSIEEAGWLDATLRYSGNFSIDKSQALLVDSKYSKLYFGSVNSMVCESKYDNLNIETIHNLVLNGGYTDINIGTLIKKLVFEGAYGAFDVDRIPAGFESLKTNSRYCGIRMGIEESAAYKLDAKMSYGSLKIEEDNFKTKKRIVNNTSSETTGIMGNDESPSSDVSITSSYGSVKLY